MKKRGFFLISVLILIFFLVNPSKLSENIYNVTKENGSGENKIIIIPHFNGAGEVRDKFLSQYKGKYNQVIVLTPNHYSYGDSDITISSEDFETGKGRLVVNRSLIENFTNANIGKADQGAFFNEHGVKNLLDSLSKNFLSSQVTAFSIRSGAKDELLQNFVSFIESNLKNSLIIASVDFSHYNPSSLAKIHDRYSINALEDLDLQKIKKLEVDSPESLFVTSQIAINQSKKFKLYENKNSGEIDNVFDKETTSYVIGSYENEGTNFKSSTFVMAGDFMLDRLVYHQFKNNLNKIFEKFGPRVFQGVDLSAVNLEGPIDSEAITDDVTPNNLVFNFPKETAKILSDLNINFVSLANNHSANAGEGGKVSTKNLLSSKNINFAGDQNSYSADSIKDVNAEIPIKIITTNSLVTEGEKLIPDIKKEKTGENFVIVFAHWGNEYQTQHNQHQQKAAEKWIDAGADMVVGSHPHVVQDIGFYKNKPIIYSMGNFLFDQTFSQDTQKGLIIGGIITEKDITISFFPTKQIQLKPQLLNGEEKSEVIKERLKINDDLLLSSDTIKLTR